MIARDIVLYLSVFGAGLLVVVFIGIVYMTGVWVKMAEQMKRDGTLRRRRSQFIVNSKRHAAQH